MREITKLAKRHFKNPDAQTWYAKLNKNKWRVFIVDKKTKKIILKCPSQTNPNDAFLTAYDEIKARINESVIQNVRDLNK